MSAQSKQIKVEKLFGPDEKYTPLIRVNIQIMSFYRDMYNEIMVAVVKKAILNQHSRVLDLQIQTLIRSLSVMTALHDRNLKARLFTSAGMQRSRDLVGTERRQILREAVRNADPFNPFNRECVTDSSVKSKGSPFTVSAEDLRKFINNAKAKYRLDYPTLT